MKQNKQEIHRKKNVFLLAFQSLGIVYGDLSISPLYVYRSAFSHPLHRYQTEEVVFGAFSLIFWSLTIFPLFKYVVLLLSAHDNGEGGTLALYSLLCRHAKVSVLQNHQAADEEVSAYRRPGYSDRHVPTSSFRRYLDKHKRTRHYLLVAVLFAACMVIGDGVFTPAISVLSSLEGLKGREKVASQKVLVTIVCIVLVCLFALQHRGTHKVSFMFAPAVVVWLLAIATLGVYNMVKWNPKICKAFSPHYIFLFFRHTGRLGWISIGGMLLCITGTEAMNVDLGHFSPTPIRIAFSGIVYPCLVLQYMGQAAYLSKNFEHAPSSFYSSVPEPLYWVFFSLAVLAAIVASQAVISATFSIVKQCQALGCFPRVKIVHTSRWIEGQIYIPEINWILMGLSVLVTVGFQDTILIGQAYGLSFMIVTCMNTGLLWLVSVFVWHFNLTASFLIILFFGPIELIYLSSSSMKILTSGWAPLLLATFFTSIMYIWYYGNRCRYLIDAQNKVPMKWILALGPTLGIVRVPGIGLIYTELVTGVPAIFTHFVTNLPAIHQVVVFVSVKNIPIPHVSTRERYLVGRIGPKSYRMYRCIIRYGYKDVSVDEEDFEDNLVMSIAEFIQLEAESAGPSPDGSLEGRMAMVRTSGKFGTRLVSMQGSDRRSSKSDVFRRLESPDVWDSHRSHTRFQLADEDELVQEVKEELEELVEAKDSGVAYIVGHSHIKARRHSSFLKRFAINAAYSFLRKNCRSPSVSLHIPHISLIEVGMNYHV